MKKCDDIVEVLFSGGDLSEEMRTHIQRCDECRHLKESIMRLDSLGAEARELDISKGAVSRVLASARAIQAQRVRAPHTRMIDWWLLRGLAAAALFVIIAGGSVMLIRQVVMRGVGDSTGLHQLETVPSFVDLDQGRHDIRRAIAGFTVRYVQSREGGGLDSDLEHIRERMARARAGIQYELYGMN